MAVINKAWIPQLVDISMIISKHVKSLSEITFDVATDASGDCTDGLNLTVRNAVFWDVMLCSRVEMLIRVNQNNCITVQKTVAFIVTAVKTSVLTT